MDELSYGIRGEINGESWILRNIWDNRMGAKRGIISQPKKLECTAVKRIMESALWTQGLRKKLEKGKKRHEFKPTMVTENGLKLRAHRSRNQKR